VLTKYIQAVMRRATYEILEDDRSYYGRSPDLQGAWANSSTLEGCRDELQEVVEDWILTSIASHQPLPVIEGINLEITADVG